jgi:hypothetical protein
MKMLFLTFKVVDLNSSAMLSLLCLMFLFPNFFWKTVEEHDVPDT